MLNRLPPLNAIKAFHAASRHLNLSRAAEELGVTQGAVSKQILALEDFIGAKLFERLPTGLELTREGNSLKNVTWPAFDLLLSGFSRYERRPPRSQKVRISTLASFASSILAPRLSRLEAEFPDVQFEILTSDRLLDHAREEIDFSIRYGQARGQDLQTDPIGSANIIPVCAAGETLDPQMMLRFQVFAINEWRAWEDANGDALTRHGQSLIIEEFVVALSAVLKGQGFAILPELMVLEHIRAGSLARFGDPIQNWPYQYYFAFLPQALNRKPVAPIIDWIKSEIADITEK
ncbi:MAG: LysR substrate-binding domain-containing protein [Pseudomonadota bacterium]